MQNGRIEVKPGDWVILKGDSVLYSDKDLRKVVRKAEDMDDEDITVSKEPAKESCFY